MSTARAGNAAAADSALAGGGVPARREWPSLLLGLGRARVISVATGLGVEGRATPLRRTRHGLGMLRVREGVLGEVFNLGEFSMAEAAVRLATDDGQSVEGGAAVLADDDALAEAAALLDAVMLAGSREGASAAEQERAGVVAALLREASARRAEENRLRSAMLGATKVDFALLNQDTGSAGGSGAER